MRQEFQRSMDDITNQFRIEAEERDKQADSIDASAKEIIENNKIIIE